MTTIGQDIAASIRYAADKVAGDGVSAVNRATGAVQMLALAVNNLASSIDNQASREDPDDDGEPVRRPFSAWPKVKMSVPTDREFAK